MGWKKDLRASWRLDPVSGQRLKRRSTSNDVPPGIDLERWGRLVTLFGALHDYLYVLRCDWVVGKMERVEQMGG